ncbi:MAG: sulfotransferase [Phycisphaerales bacterium]
MNAIQRQLQQAIALHRSGQLAGAEAAYRAVLSKSPGLADAKGMLGLVVAGQGRVDEGMMLLEEARRLKPKDPTICFNLGNLLRNAGRLEEARGCYEAVVSVRRDHGEAWYGLAVVEEQARNRSAACEAANEALRCSPGHAMATIVLARLERGAGELDAAESRLNALLAASTLQPVERVHASVELGRVLDRAGQYEDAFEAFDAGQAAMRLMPEYARSRPERFREMVGRLPAVVTPERLRSWRAAGAPGERSPIFLVGFPRSGTTMMEQILGAHPACVTTDERPFVQNLVRALPSVAGLDHPEALAVLDDGAASRLRALYDEQVTGFVGDVSGVDAIVDKQPMNLAYVGLLRRVFPGMKLIVVIRDPRDVCLSCYMQAFTPNQAMANFCDLATTVELYASLMSFWLNVRDALADDLLEVRYEDAIADTPAVAGRLLEFVGLPWTDDVLAFHEKVGDRYIRTPSSEAVARPVYDTSVGRWRRYRSRLEPHLDRLHPFVEAFGYASDDAMQERMEP